MRDEIKNYEIFGYWCNFFGEARDKAVPKDKIEEYQRGWDKHEKKKNGEVPTAHTFGKYA